MKSIASLTTVAMCLLPLLAATVTPARAQDPCGRWAADVFPHPGPGDNVFSLVEFDDASGPALFAGGNFAVAGNVAASSVARFDGTSWSSLGDGIDGSVFALAVFDDGRGRALYAAGSFERAGDVPAKNIARWDGTS